MTVDECAIAILQDVAPLTLVHLDGKPQRGWTNTVSTLRALVDTESERTAALADRVAEQTALSPMPPTNDPRAAAAALFRSYAAHLRSTSPGKVDQ